MGTNTRKKRLGKDRPNKSHTVFSRRSFLSFTATMFAIEMIQMGYGLVDLAFISSFGLIMVAAVGLGDLISLLYLAFFRGIIDVYASRLARAEGGVSSSLNDRCLLKALFLASLLWTFFAISVSQLTPLILDILGSESEVAEIASGYVKIRMLALPFSLTFEIVAVTLRIKGKKNVSIGMVFIGFIFNAIFNAVFLYGPVASLFSNPVNAVAFATVAAQVIGVIGGSIFLACGFRGDEDGDRYLDDRQNIFKLAFEILKKSLGIGIQQLNNYAAAVFPFLLISRLDVSTIASVTVATKIWTLYCRAPQSALNASGVFIAYARGDNRDAANAVARRCFKYVYTIGLASAAVVIAMVPVLAKIFGGQDINTSFVWLLTLVYMIGIPAYFVEHFCSEILVLEQRAAWLSIPSTLATYAITVPIAFVGVFICKSAVVAIFTATTSSILLAFIYKHMTTRLGYDFFLFGALRR